MRCWMDFGWISHDSTWLFLGVLEILGLSGPTVALVVALKRHEEAEHLLKCYGAEAPSVRALDGC